MERYEVRIEAMGYGQPEDETAALAEALIESDVAMIDGGLVNAAAPVAAEVMADEGRGLLLVRLLLDAVHALDAHASALELWTEVWEQAFPEQAEPSIFAVTAIPMRLRAAVRS